MKTFRVLNAYAGIGGNRTDWDAVFARKGIKNASVTAIERNPAIAEIYRTRFPQDEVLIEDAHQYILKHHDEFDFVWSSPPCVTHSQMEIMFRRNYERRRYINAALWQQIIFLRQWHSKLWLVENVRPYYGPLIPPTVRVGRHLFWSNFRFGCKTTRYGFKFVGDDRVRNEIPLMEKYLGFTLPDVPAAKQVKKDQILRNCIHPSVGAQIMEAALGLPRRPEKDTFGF